MKIAPNCKDVIGNRIFVFSKKKSVIFCFVFNFIHFPKYKCLIFYDKVFAIRCIKTSSIKLVKQNNKKLVKHDRSCYNSKVHCKVYNIIKP